MHVFKMFWLPLVSLILPLSPSVPFSPWPIIPQYSWFLLLFCDTFRTTMGVYVIPGLELSTKVLLGHQWEHNWSQWISLSPNLLKNIWAVRERPSELGGFTVGYSNANNHRSQQEPIIQQGGIEPTNWIGFLLEM